MWLAKTLMDMTQKVIMWALNLLDDQQYVLLWLNESGKTEHE